MDSFSLANKANSRKIALMNEMKAKGFTRMVHESVRDPETGMEMRKVRRYLPPKEN